MTKIKVLCEEKNPDETYIKYDAELHTNKEFKENSENHLYDNINYIYNNKHASQRKLEWDFITVDPVLEQDKKLKEVQENTLNRRKKKKSSNIHVDLDSLSTPLVSSLPPTVSNTFEWTFINIDPPVQEDKEPKETEEDTFVLPPLAPLLFGSIKNRQCDDIIKQDQEWEIRRRASILKTTARHRIHGAITVSPESPQVAIPVLSSAPSRSSTKTNKRLHCRITKEKKEIDEVIHIVPASPQDHSSLPFQAYSTNSSSLFYRPLKLSKIEIDEKIDGMACILSTINK